ncbi:MAG TPA: hypothetical protein VFC73_04985 [Syntrophomonadaceae bacterium]|nr:hypothetical protein [Syntrophomonadaceae bacterium]
MPTATSLYKNIFEQILTIETCKKDLSKKILLLKEGKRRTSYIYAFLSYDFNKHELLEHATIVALHNYEETILENIKKFYSHCTEDEILTCIRKEIKTSKMLLDSVKKQMHNKSELSFTEKRMFDEVCKYVVEQAREYMKINK